MRRVLCVLRRVYGQKGVYALGKVKHGQRWILYIWRGILCIGMSPNAFLEDDLRGKLRVIAKFQANLAIPKHSQGYLSTRGRGYVHRGAI